LGASPVLKDLKTINIGIINETCSNTFEIANEWRRRIEDAQQTASDGGKLPSAASRPIVERPPPDRWQQFLRSVKDAGRKFIALWARRPPRKR
jgi:hypothetical protein